jgi:hypothetical protein
MTSVLTTTSDQGVQYVYTGDHPAANYRNQIQVSTALQINVAETPYVYHKRTLPNTLPSTFQEYLPILSEVP